MRIECKNGIVLLSKPENPKVSQDIIVDDTDEERTLVVSTVLSNSDNYKEGDKVVIGKYSLFCLEFDGSILYFAEVEDILAVIKQ